MCRKQGEDWWSITASLFLLIVFLAIHGVAHGQNIRACGTPSPLSPQTAATQGGLAGSSGQGGGSLEVIPSVCVSERYDSNVFYAPPTPGLQRGDFVTNVTPMLRINQVGEYASGFLNVAGFGETYIKNPDLNYIGGNGTLSLNLDGTIKKLLPNATLTVFDYISYTPLPPAFINPTAGTSPGAPGNIQNVYAQGFLAMRTNNLINNGTVATSYATTASTNLNAAYNVSTIRFGSNPTVPGGTNLFNTTIQAGLLGGTARLSELDTLNLKYSHTITDFTSTSPSTSTSSSALFKTDVATIGWARVFTPNLSAEIGGGGIIVTPGITTYAANAALVMNSQDSRATISYSHSAFPSFANVPLVLVGDAVAVSAFQRITRQWQLNETASYSYGSGGSGVNATLYRTLYAGVDLQYWITGVWSASLSYDYQKFNYEFGLSKTDFDRNVVTINIRATWS